MAKEPARSRVKMLGKIIAGVLGSRIAESSGKSGAVGAAAGLVASRIMRRSPLGAVVVGAAWVGHKLYKRNQERKLEIAAKNAKPARTGRLVSPPGPPKA